MNIFVLHKNPKKAAIMTCDRHCIKMILETGQLLCTVSHEYGFDAPYGSTHKKHPCTLWIQESKKNWIWLQQYGIHLCEEYTHRYGKTHKTESIIRALPIPELPDIPLTPFAQAMPEEYRCEDVVLAYRRYYCRGKGYMNKGLGPLWNKDPSKKPYWYSFGNEPSITPQG